MYTSVRKDSSFCPPPPGRVGQDLKLNFHNHCLLCLQHVDPSVLEAIAQENPKGLSNFQPILHYLMGTMDPSSWNNNSGGQERKGVYYPVTTNLPPLCTICYDVLAELYKFHEELMELQRKIQNQVEAARRIVKETPRRTGGTMSEFFNMLHSAGYPMNEVEAMQYFLGNFHGQTIKADRKSVLPQLMTLTFDHFKPSSPQCQSKSSSPLKPYFIQFTGPMTSSTSHISPRKTPQLGHSPVKVFSNRVIQVGIPNPAGGGPFSGLLMQAETKGMNRSHSQHIVETPNFERMQFEYEDDEEDQSDATKVQKDDDIMVLEDEADTNGNMLEEKTKVLIKQLEVQEEDTEDPIHPTPRKHEKESLEYWRSALSSLVTFEVVDGDNESVNEAGEEPVAELEPPPPHNIELIDLVVDDEEGGIDSMMEYSSSEYDQYNHQSLPCPTTGQLTILSVASSSTGSLPSTSTTSPDQGSPKQPSYRCHACGIGFHSRSGFWYHKQEHLPGGRPKPFVCSYCNKGFSLKTGMVKHERVHTGERPYECDICHVKFRQSATLHRHKLTHKDVTSSGTQPHLSALLPLTASNELC